MAEIDAEDEGVLDRLIEGAVDLVLGPEYEPVEMTAEDVDGSVELTFKETEEMVDRLVGLTECGIDPVELIE